MRKDVTGELQQKKPLYNRAEKTILVVEDDRTHQALMKKILMEYDFNAVIAEDGIAALTMLDTGLKIDLIIMDWDMPRLNGLDTVREIRRRESKGELARVPVVAFTSNRAAGDREKCLAAGMDGYLPKDIWLPHWRQTLLDNLLQGFLADDIKSENASRAPSSETLAHSASLDAFDPKTLGETMTLLKEEFPFVVDEYLEDAAAYIRDIRDGVAEKNPEKVARGSHPLKSNSKGLGLVALAGIAEQINHLAREAMKNQNPLDQIEILLPRLLEAFQRAEKRLREVVKNAGF